MQIVFVHFGHRIPSYLYANLVRVSDLFPNHRVILIADRPHRLKLTRKNFENKVIELKGNYVDVNHLLAHPRDFRENFWFSTLARLLAVCDYAINTNDSILHIESDVYISNDFPLDKFSGLDRPSAYTIVGELSGVASVLWLRDSKIAELLKKYILSEVKEDSMTTDMKILGKFKAESPSSVRILASFPWKSVSLNFPLGKGLEEDFEYSTKLFDGFFDSADVGQYLFGDDPRNHRGIKYVRRELLTSYLRPRSLNYKYSNNRHFIDISDDENFKIFSLHIHCKDSKLFDTRRNQKLFKLAIRKQKKAEGHILVFYSFLNALRFSIVRRLKITFTKLFS